jgi:hypothetical protein
MVIVYTLVNGEWVAPGRDPIPAGGLTDGFGQEAFGTTPFGGTA